MILSLPKRAIPLSFFVCVVLTFVPLVTFEPSIASVRVQISYLIRLNIYVKILCQRKIFIPIVSYHLSRLFF